MSASVITSTANRERPRAFRAFPVPVGGVGDPGHLADWVMMMLSPAAAFLCGSVIVVDGGSEAWLRPGEWPRPVALRQVPRYLSRYRAFARSLPVARCHKPC